MIAGFEDAVDALKPDAEPAANWFTPEGDQNFLPPDLITHFAEVLLLAFLAGFQQEAKKAVKQAGKSAVGWLKDTLTDLFKSKKPAPKGKHVNEDAEEAAETASKLSENEFDAAVAASTKNIRVTLEGTLSRDDAGKLSIKIKDAAVQHVLKKKRKR